MCFFLRGVGGGWGDHGRMEDRNVPPDQNHNFMSFFWAFFIQETGKNPNTKKGQANSMVFLATCHRKGYFPSFQGCIQVVEINLTIQR